MGNGRPFRRGLHRADIEAAATASARGQGCTCEPELTLTESAAGVHHVTLAHDSWCPLILARNAVNN